LLNAGAPASRAARTSAEIERFPDYEKAYYYAKKRLDLLKGFFVKLNVPGWRNKDECEAVCQTLCTYIFATFARANSV
jgi:hypothetical protein